ncbi:hypothetical protein [Thermosporothrix hazakensis]|uniref:hypothetical protein n=1 Tax=Thermosporothrix hazakensis TaxID=644383 RepID=UPI000DAD1AEE|nr:hypothetical protein [Thermosporothrix hazakensis]
MGQCLSAIGLRIVMFWISNNTRIAVILFHCMINVSEFFFPVYGSHYDPVLSGSITMVLLSPLLWGPKTLAGFAPLRRATGR